MLQHLPTPLPLSAIGALALGHKIDAIKIVRQEASLSLKEAKAAVDAYELAHPDLQRQQPAKKIVSTSLWLSGVVAFIAAACITWIFLLFNQG